MTTPIGYLDGDILPVAEMRLSVFDLGVVGGIAVAEMFRTFRHEPFRVADHLDRLELSLSLTGLSCDLPRDELARTFDRVVRHNSALINKEDDLGAIVFVTAGLNPTYVGREAARRAGSSLGIHSFSLQSELWAEKYDAGVTLVTPTRRSLPAEIVDPRAKVRSRMHWHLAEREARSIAPGATALVVNDLGQVTETAASNVIAVFGNQLVSPPEGDVLEGVSLRMTQELASASGRNVVRRPLTVAELQTADEVLLTSTPPCLLPATRLNGQPIGGGQPGPVFRELLGAWSAAVGVDIRSQMQRHP